MGVNSDKIIQYNVTNRLKFKDIFDFVDTEKLKGYIVFCNADMFFDKTLSNLNYSTLDQNKQILCQLRFEYTNADLRRCKMFGPRADSQDTWIFHSNFNPKNRSIFNFKFGVPGCDNKFLYLLSISGFEIFNDPYFVKTYHNHKSIERNYGNAFVPPPYMLVSPHVQGRNFHNETHVWGIVGQRLLKTHKTTIETTTRNFSRFMFKMDNNILRDYLKDKIKTNSAFLIPSATKESIIISSLGLMLNNVTDGIFFKTGNILKQYQNNTHTKYLCNLVISLLAQIPNNKITDMPDLIKYTFQIASAFNLCEICARYPVWNIIYNKMVQEKKHEFYNHFINTFKNNKWLDDDVTNIFHFIHDEPWTIALADKNILILSPHANAIKQQVETVQLKDIYGIDLFKGCNFTFLEYNNKPTVELQNDISSIIEDFDVALCGCNMYGTALSHYIYKAGKSAIDVGDKLPLYFGLWNPSIMTDYKDALKLYFNEHWTRINF